MTRTFMTTTAMLLLATTAGAPVDRYRLQRPAGARDFRLASARLDQPAAPAVTLPALSPGVLYPIRIARVLATGTTATGIKGLV